jgi:hypothetical protein
MGFQLRHKTMGVYQGSFLGLGFWHLESEMPEQGYCEFPTENEALEYRHFLLVDCDQPLKDEDLTIEPFNKIESDALILSAKKIV